MSSEIFDLTQPKIPKRETLGPVYNFSYPWTILFSKIYYMLGLSGTSSIKISENFWNFIFFTNIYLSNQFILAIFIVMMGRAMKLMNEDSNILNPAN